MPDVERRICPPEYQQRLTEVVGANQYGDPLFKLGWGQSETYTAGGVWAHDHFFGYRQLMLSNSNPAGKGQPCWMVLEWHPPEDYESAALWYYRNRDDATGLQTLGEYPYKGRYEVAYKLMSQTVRDGRLENTYYHLDGMVLDWLIPIIVMSKHASLADRKAFMNEQLERNERELDRQIDDLFKDATKRRPLPSQIHHREILIQQQMSKFLKNYGRPMPGFSAIDKGR